MIAETGVMTGTEEHDKLRRLLDVGRALVSELDTEAVLRRILDEAREITGARYVALGVLNEQRSELERFLTSGIDEEAHQAIGDLPRGRGVLGVLIDDPRPLRLRNVGSHPQSFGFPPNHPPMGSFLGVPVLIRGQAWGNLYLTEKAGGFEFTDADEEAVIVLAQWAATAIENARLYENSERRRHDAEQALRGLRAARDIAEAIAGAEDLDRVLELIVKRGRALVDARAVLIMLCEGDELVVSAAAGEVERAEGQRLPISGSTSGQVLEQGRPARVSDVSAHLRITPARLGVPDARTALLVPMIHRGHRVGVLAAFDRGQQAATFTVEQEQLLRSFASSAANAVTIHRSVEADRLRSAITAADAERGRWARELHDQTLQALGGLRVVLASGLRRADTDALRNAVAQAVEDIELEIDNLRGIITDLRPSLLDDLGLLPALDALIDRRRHGGLNVVSELSLSGAGLPLKAELETTVYRIVQETLTNAVKHAQASTVRVTLTEADGQVVLQVVDNGVGFDPAADTAGFGLAGMHERVYLAGGTLEIRSGSEGTEVHAELPVGHSDGARSNGARSNGGRSNGGRSNGAVAELGADQVAS